MDASSKWEDSLPTTSGQLLKFLDDCKITFTFHEHPPIFTVKDAKSYQRGMKGIHVKNLFLRDKKKQNFLIVTEQDHLINLKNLPSTIQSDKLSFGSSERLFEFLGIRPGAVSPFALINDKENNVTLVLEKKLESTETIFFHPLVNDKTVGITFFNFQKFLTAIDHQHRIEKI